MKFFDEMYVGFQRERYTNADEPRLLGFMVPNGTTKAEQNRIATVDRWSNDKKDCRVLPNTPRRGFKLVEVVSRYSTSNKYFRVMDPQGFELEISAANLLDLAMASTIVKGEIIEECIWAQHNGAYLIPASSEEYAYHTKAKVKGKTVMEEGKYYVNVGNLLSIFRYEGIYHHTYLEYEHKATAGEWVVVNTDGRYSYNSNRRNFECSSYETKVNIRMNSGKKPSYLYTEFRLDADGNVTNKIVHMRKSHLKNLEPYADEIPSDCAEFVLDPMEWIGYDYWNGSDKDVTYTNNNSNGSYHGYFKNKADAKAFDYTDIIHSIKASASRYRTRIVTTKFDTVHRYGYYSNGYPTISASTEQTYNIIDER